MSKQLKITKKQDVLIIERDSKTGIKKGSEIYCGYCGHSMGKLSESLDFPFNGNRFISLLKGDKYKVDENNLLKHKACGNTIGLTEKKLMFKTLDQHRGYKLMPYVKPKTA